MPVSSNYPEIAKSLSQLGQTFNLRRRLGGGKRRVGDELLDIIAVVIEVRTVQQQKDPSGQPLAKLRPFTIARKLRLGFPLDIGIETHQMLDIDEIRGDQVVRSDMAVMTYGLDDESKQKAEWFTEGNANQKPREFYDVGADGEKLVDEYIETEVIEGHIKALGGI